MAGRNRPVFVSVCTLIAGNPLRLRFLESAPQKSYPQFPLLQAPARKGCLLQKVIHNFHGRPPLQGDTGGRFWRKAAKFSASAVDNAVHTCGKVRDIHRFTPVFAGDTACQANRCKKISTIYAHNSTLTPKFGGKLPVSTKTGTCVQKNYQQFLQNVFIKSDLYTLLPFSPPPLWKTAVRLSQKKFAAHNFCNLFLLHARKSIDKF